ncbi:CO dehydrogenase/acetyl-CoA synthase delta subunit [Pseudodesulfovibrio indicus]|uniref:CO dehydrogenase/acetyl-CoA synthase delta subunit n=1 Tax=Pseudodesulfovibrio indicus TaxID=1716143 RepID=A0A126QSA6_9BACT|nr:hypothetical protein AWY79_08665 [Pseudodesulfovibrio indicus]TDT92203.1 CO dehydrogenase/acetyl-CoA synthase delta subunit [Pseudodesulfovibrio indicus]
MDTPAGPVPRVRTRMLPSDRLGTALARLGATRHRYKVVPGLYCVGNPTPDSPVLVTANYKLTFDAVRTELSGQDAWLLVTDTRGINVWCAAGKNLFATHEIVLSVRNAQLDKVVAHRTLVLPQLGAPGVAAYRVKRECGFKVVWGPVRAADLPAFLADGFTATGKMRMVDFPLRERAVLIPVEIFLLWKLLAWVLPLSFLLSAIGPDVFSFSALWQRGVCAATATLVGILAGCAAVPLLLDRLPWRQFWPKGALTGCLAGLAAVLLLPLSGLVENVALLLWTTAVSSYLAMNFTGSTPYTSPSGVEAEMRRGIPLQAAAALAGLILWLAAPFLG